MTLVPKDNKIKKGIERVKEKKNLYENSIKT